jgi:hypothetical protein
VARISSIRLVQVQAGGGGAQRTAGDRAGDRATGGWQEGFFFFRTDRRRQTANSFGGIWGIIDSGGLFAGWRGLRLMVCITATKLRLQFKVGGWRDLPLLVWQNGRDGCSTGDARERSCSAPGTKNQTQGKNAQRQADRPTEEQRTEKIVGLRITDTPPFPQRSNKNKGDKNCRNLLHRRAGKGP